MWKYKKEGDGYNRYVFEPGEEGLVTRVKNAGINIITFDDGQGSHLTGVLLSRTRHTQEINTLEALAQREHYPITDVQKFPTTGIVFTSSSQPAV